MDKSTEICTESSFSGQKGREGYMTVEASLLMPLIVALIAALMILSFYMYMVCFLNQTAYKAAFRGSCVPEEDAGRRKTVTAGELDRLLEERILPVGNPEKEIHVSGTAVEVILRARLELPVPGIWGTEKVVWSVTADKKAQIRDAPAFIRGVRKLRALS